ncbi:MAG TPA: hypothetical protein PKB10_08460, partial [Tepidisphaeraceae bacterium]|nr:hypothetical protein [Tepidisphaeraceae bacterium]
MSMQNTSGGELDGSWTEYSSSNWSLAPTSFGLRTMVNTLQLLANGPAINVTTHQNTINATLRGLREMLRDDYWLNRGNDYSNQYSAVWGAALDFVALFPQHANEFHGYLNARFPSAATKHQSPTGFLYEAGGPDFAYTQGTHQTNITNGWHRLRGSAYQSFVVDESQKLYDWVRYNFVRQPSGAGYLTNYGATTRLAGRFFAVGNNANPISEFVPDARFLDRTSAEEAQVLVAQRSALTNSWDNWGPLANPSSNSYSPTPFNNVDLVGWRPTEQQRLD